MRNIYKLAIIALIALAAGGTTFSQVQVQNTGFGTIIKSGLFQVNCQTTGSFTPVDNQLYLTPVVFSRPVTWDAFQVRVLVAMGASATYRAVFYSSDANGLPTTPLESTTAISSNSIAINTTTLASARTSPAGVYWFGVVFTNSTTLTNAIQGCLLQTSLMPVAQTGQSRGGFQVALASGAAFPTNPSTATTFGGNSPQIAVRMP